MRIKNLLASASALLLFLASATAFAYSPTASRCGGDKDGLVERTSVCGCGGDEEVVSTDRCGGDDVVDQGRCGGDKE